MSCFLNVGKSFTGDCTNSSIGAISVDIFGTAPDYTIQWIEPASYGTIALGAGVTGYTETGLSGGTYVFNVIDTCSPTSTVFPISFYISTGTCTSILATQDTTCNLYNGSLTASTINVYNGNAEFYLYHNTLGYLTSGTSYTNTYSFDSLSAGTYYVVANDGGGCTGKSETCLVQPSSEMDFGFFIVNNAGCTGNTGKIYITGLTGNPPYTYLWQDYSMNDFITDLPSGNYSVQVSDSSGCVLTKNANVLDVPQLGIVSFSSINPDCFINNGSVTVYTSGGTLPFYYSGSNGYSVVTYDTEYTFENIGSGIFSVLITDAALCSANGSTSIMVPQGFSIVNIGIQNSVCNNFSGALNPITIFGPSQPYNYTLTYPDGITTESVTVNSTSWSFDGLSSGTYSLSISGGTCVFTNDYTITNEVLYDLIVSTTGTTCNGSNGSVSLNIDGAVGPFIYTITTRPSITSSDTSVTFTNLPTGSYTSTTLDTITNCLQRQEFFINPSQSVYFSLVATDATSGSNGMVESYISGGTPPFTYLWSNGQTTPNISGLGKGDYTLTITDTNGCTSQRTITVYGWDSVSSYKSYTICEDTFVDGGNVKKGIKEMYVEGFFDEVSNDFNCVLDSATFIAQVTVDGELTTTPFFYSNSLTIYPSDNLWFSAVTTILETYPNIGDVIINYPNNTITINTNCDQESLHNSKVVVTLRIEYIISCEKCNLDCDIEYTQPPADFCTGNLITNPTFNTNLNGWSQFGGDEWSWSPNNGGSANFGGTDNFNNSIYQNILTVGATYNISFTLYYNAPCTEYAYVKVFAGTSESSLIQSGGQINLTLTCTGNNSFGISAWDACGTSGSIYVDNVCVIQTTPPLEVFTINAIGVNQVAGAGAALGFIFNSTNNFQINWGDGTVTQYFSGSSIGASHTYSSPYTGPITILSTNLTTILGFTAQSEPHLNQSLWVSTTELNKLDGLLNLNTISNGLFITGDVVNLPNTLTGLTLYNTNVSGDTSNLPSLLINCSITGTNTISGDTAGLPNNIMTFFVIQGNNTISGDVLDLPRTTYQCQIYGFNTISGDTSGLPQPSFQLDIQGNNTISGNVSNIYHSQVIWIYGLNTVSGDTSGFTSPTQNISIIGNNTISGNVSDLPSTLLSLDIRGNTSITGNISGFPPNLTFIRLTNSNFTSVFGNISTLPSTLEQFLLKSIGTLTGDLYYLPSVIKRIEITSQMTFTYTSGRVWTNNFLTLSLSPTNGWSGFNQSQTDNLLIDIQPKYVNIPGASKFSIKCSGTPKRTSASDTAFTALQTLIGSSNVILN